MEFTKMQGLGNDYLYFYEEVPENVAELAIRLSDRHFGAGSDGLIYICHSDVADFKMRIFNADGSEAQMCGNGIRCVGKLVYEKGLTNQTILTVETCSGVKPLQLHVTDGRVCSVSVLMGRAETQPERELLAGGRRVAYTPVSVGNPHAVVFVPDAETIPLGTLGPLIERHPDFPGGVNVEFVQILSEARLRMRVWERGSGVTLACGTGACACAAAAVRRGLCLPDVPITVMLDGGPLEIKVDAGGSIVMTGPAETVFEGEIAP